MPGAHQVQLAIQCKKTEAVEVKSPLLSYIRSTYSDRQADEAADDLVVVQQLRGVIALAHSGSPPALRDSITKYIRCLTAIETRFPISKEKGHAQINFTWFDAFRPSKRLSQYNVHFEKAAVLFNLAAVMSQQALSSDRTTADGLKAACQFFQEAAGAFQYLKDNEANKTDNPRPLDLSPECITMLEKLMLAQAQESVYNKCLIDRNKSPATLARLAKQIAIMYDEVERLFAAPVLAGYFDKSWVAHVQLKASLYDVETLVRFAQSYRAEDKVSTEICVLQEAFKRLQNTKKLAKGISSEMLDSVNNTQDAIQLALTKAEKDNATIYLERVPAFLDLPVVQGALLVKAQPPTGIDASQEQLFTGLVPDTSAKALSKYTDMVDNLIREQLDRLASATDTARLRLREWELPESLEALDVKTNSALPDAVRQELEDIESIGGASHLKGILAEIGELRKTVDGDLFQAQVALDADQTQDMEARQKYGDRWQVQQSASVAKPYWDRIATYRASMQKAAESDQGVMRRMQDSDAAFANLRIDAAALQMPRLQAPLINPGSEDPARIVANLRRNIASLQSLAAERAGMEEALKDLKKKDNVLPKLMACSPHAQDALFTAELRKYEPMREDVIKNCVAQEEVLLAVDRDNRAFRHVFDTAAWRQACDAAAVGIREQTRQFRELLDHLSEGLRFYIGMSEVVKKARQECQDFAFTRQVQRDELKQDLDRRAQQEEADRLSRQLTQANLHASHSSNVTYPQPPGQHQPPPRAPPPPAPYGASPSQIYGQQTPHQAYYGTPQVSQPTPHYGYSNGSSSSGSAAPHHQQQAYGAQPASGQGYGGYTQPPQGYPSGGVAPPPSYAGQPHQPQHGQQQYGQPPPQQQQQYGAPNPYQQQAAPPHYQQW